MRKLTEAMEERIRGFVVGDEHIALVIESTADDLLPLLKVIEEVETKSASDLHWTFTDSFVDAASYVSSVVSSFATQHEAMCEAMEAEGMSVWPPMPERVCSDEVAPGQRLRELAAFSRELLPVPNGGNNVWAYVPLEVHDPQGFAALMSEVLAHSFPFPWCHHLRFIVRDTPDSESLGLALGSWARIDWWQPDLSQEAVDRALADQLADDSAPLAERMGALMLSAGSDLALQRPQSALEKYTLMLRYHAPMGNLAMAAVALNGMGEAYEKLEQPEWAEASYHAALAPASDGDPPAIPVLLNITMNLANLRMRQHRWAEAEGYWDSVQQLAVAARNAPLRIEALERRGMCQEYQGKYDEAEESWNGACIMAAKIEDPVLSERLLGRLEEFYRRLSREEEASAIGLMRADLSG